MANNPIASPSAPDRLGLLDGDRVRTLLPENMTPEDKQKLFDDLDANKDGKLQVTETAEYMGVYVDAMRVRSELTPENELGAVKRDEIAADLRVAATPENIIGLHNELGELFPQRAEPMTRAEAESMSGVASRYARQIDDAEYTLAGDEERRIAAKQSFAERSIGDLADRNDDGRVGLGERLLFNGQVGIGSLFSQESRDLRDAKREMDIRAGAERAQRYSEDADPTLQYEERSGFQGNSAVPEMEAALRAARAQGIGGDYKPAPTERVTPKSPNQAVIDQMVAQEKAAQGL